VSTTAVLDALAWVVVALVVVVAIAGLVELRTMARRRAARRAQWAEIRSALDHRRTAVPPPLDLFHEMITDPSNDPEGNRS
jgi:hypothetical protein